MLRPKIKNKNDILWEMLQTVLLSEIFFSFNFDLFFMVFIAVIYSKSSFQLKRFGSLSIFELKA